MKFEEKIKQKYLYKTGFNLIKYIYFWVHKFKGRKYAKKSFSGSAQDIIIDKFFENNAKGVYIDVGCYHPYNGNNTKLLYDKGWSGINIDLDFHTIDFFNFIRKRDKNINIAISDTQGKKELYFFHNRSALNSLSKLREKDAKETRAIQTITLNSVIENSKFKNKKINLLSIDVEGYEHQVLQSIDLKKYSPEMIIVEYLDREIINNFKFYNQNINHILSSEIHQLLIKNDYSLINLIHSDLIYIHSSAKK